MILQHRLSRAGTAAAEEKSQVSWKPPGLEAY